MEIAEFHKRNQERTRKAMEYIHRQTEADIAALLDTMTLQNMSLNEQRHWEAA